MAKKERGAAKSNQAVSQRHGKGRAQPSGIAVVRRGLRLGPDFAEFMACAAADTYEGLITPSVCNASCNATGKVIKIFEMTQKYGGGKPLRLAGPPTA